jgi:hypothetical protein
MDGATANKMVEKYGGLVTFGRHFIANVSRVFVCWWSLLSKRIAARSPSAPEGLSLMRYNRDTFCATEAAAGYIDYPFANNVVALQASYDGSRGVQRAHFQLTHVRECIWITGMYGFLSENISAASTIFLQIPASCVHVIALTRGI